MSVDRRDRLRVGSRDWRMTGPSSSATEDGPAPPTLATAWLRSRSSGASSYRREKGCRSAARRLATWPIVRSVAGRPRSNSPKVANSNRELGAGGGSKAVVRGGDHGRVLNGDGKGKRSSQSAEPPTRSREGRSARSGRCSSGRGASDSRTSAVLVRGRHMLEPAEPLW